MLRAGNRLMNERGSAIRQNSTCYMYVGYIYVCIGATSLSSGGISKQIGASYDDHPAI